VESPRCLAAAQTLPVPGDVRANLERHVRSIRVAAQERARVLVFPELSLTGYEFDVAAELAFSEDDPRLAPLSDAAAAASMTLVVGAPVRIESRVYIGAFILYPDGSRDVYTKHHLGAFPDAARVDGIVPPPESTVFHSGTRNPLVQMEGGPASVAICADVGRPAHAQAAAERGATTYLASMFVIPSEFDGETEKLARYAKQHSMTVVMANYGAPSGGLASAGRSTIWSPDGSVLARLGRSGAGVVIAREGAGGWTGVMRAV
jgi:predicted amidohydrolase